MFFQSCITCLFCGVYVREYICGKEKVSLIFVLFLPLSLTDPAPKCSKLQQKCNFREFVLVLNSQNIDQQILNEGKFDTIFRYYWCKSENFSSMCDPPVFILCVLALTKSHLCVTQFLNILRHGKPKPFTVYQRKQQQSIYFQKLLRIGYLIYIISVRGDY